MVATTTAHSFLPKPMAKVSTPTQMAVYTQVKSYKIKPADMVRIMIHIVVINISENGNKIYHKERVSKSFRMVLIIKGILKMGLKMVMDITFVILEFIRDSF